MTSPSQAVPAALHRARIAVAGLFFFNGALFATWAARIPAVQTQRGLDHGELGLVLLMLGLGAVLAMPLAGLLIARVGSRVLCRVLAVLLCVFLAAAMLLPGMALFVSAVFAFGACHGALDIAMNAQAVAVERRYGRPIMSSFHALWSVGGLSGAGIGGLLAAQGLSAQVHVAGGAALLGLAVLTAFPALVDAQAEESRSPEAAGPRFGLPGQAVITLGLVALFIMLGEGAMADWIAVYMRQEVHTSEGMAAAGYATFSLAMAAGRFAGDALALRHGAVRLVRAGTVLAAGGLTLALAVPQAWATLPGMACVGAGYATVVPLVFSAAGNRTDVAPGAALAAVTTLGYMGFLAGPPLIGFAAELMGLRGALGLVVVTSLAAAALAGALKKGGR